MQPTAADSVGVAMPMKIEPSTNTIRVIGGRMAMRAFLTLTNTVPSWAGMAGPAFLSMNATTRM
ncbi:MAG: hypothetical protein ACD_75C00677G0001 [uncultured bacterium]|nr:MAG: hypothetical protein ACD_75C00677G0001 [uncultured bacterium]